MYNFISSVEKSRFDKFVLDSALASFFSLSVRKELKEVDERFEGFLVGMEDDKKELVAVAQLLYMPAKKFKNMWITYGPIVDYKNKILLKKFIFEIDKFCKSMKIDAVNIEPPFVISKYDNKLNQIYEVDYDINKEFRDNGYEYLGTKDILGNYQLRCTSIINLTLDEEELLNKMSSSKRGYLSKNSKYYNVRIVEGDIEDLKYLIKYRNQLSEKKDFFVEPLSYYETFYEFVNKEHRAKIVKVIMNLDEAINNINSDIREIETKVETAREKEKPVLKNQITSLIKRVTELEVYKEKNSCEGDYVIGCALRIYVKDTMVNMFAHIDKDLTNIGATNVLVYNMMIEAKKDGYKYNDLYGLPNPFDKENRDYSLATFKLEFGGDVVEYIGAFRKVINKKKYFVFNIFDNFKKIINKIRS